MFAPHCIASATENPYEPITSGAEITSHQIPLDIKTALRNYEKLWMKNTRGLKWPSWPPNIKALFLLINLQLH